MKNERQAVLKLLFSQGGERPQEAICNFLGAGGGRRAKHTLLDRLSRTPDEILPAQQLAVTVATEDAGEGELMTHPCSLPCLTGKPTSDHLFQYHILTNCHNSSKLTQMRMLSHPGGIRPPQNLVSVTRDSLKLPCEHQPQLKLRLQVARRSSGWCGTRSAAAAPKP